MSVRDHMAATATVRALDVTVHGASVVARLAAHHGSMALLPGNTVVCLLHHGDIAEDVLESPADLVVFTVAQSGTRAAARTSTAVDSACTTEEAEVCAGAIILQGFGACMGDTCITAGQDGASVVVALSSDDAPDRGIHTVTVDAPAVLHADGGRRRFATTAMPRAPARTLVEQEALVGAGYNWLESVAVDRHGGMLFLDVDAREIASVAPGSTDIAVARKLSGTKSFPESNLALAPSGHWLFARETHTLGEGAAGTAISRKSLEMHGLPWVGSAAQDTSVAFALGEFPVDGKCTYECVCTDTRGQALLFCTKGADATRPGVGTLLQGVMLKIDLWSGRVAVLQVRDRTGGIWRPRLLHTASNTFMGAILDRGDIIVADGDGLHLIENTGFGDGFHAWRPARLAPHVWSWSQHHRLASCAQDAVRTVLLVAARARAQAAEREHRHRTDADADAAVGAGARAITRSSVACNASHAGRTDNARAGAGAVGLNPCRLGRLALPPDQAWLALPPELWHYILGMLEPRLIGSSKGLRAHAAPGKHGACGVAGTAADSSGSSSSGATGTGTGDSHHLGQGLARSIDTDAQAVLGQEELTRRMEDVRLMRATRGRRLGARGGMCQ